MNFSLLLANYDMSITMVVTVTKLVSYYTVPAFNYFIQTERQQPINDFLSLTVLHKAGKIKMI